MTDTPQVEPQEPGQRLPFAAWLQEFQRGIAAATGAPLYHGTPKTATNNAFTFDSLK